MVLLNQLGGWLGGDKKNKRYRFLRFLFEVECLPLEEGVNGSSWPVNGLEGTIEERLVFWQDLSLKAFWVAQSVLLGVTAFPGPETRAGKRWGSTPRKADSEGSRENMYK